VDHAPQRQLGPRSSNRGKWVLIGFLLVAGFFLFTEHRAHVIGFLPYLLFLACPLMHFFHHGHGNHGSNTSESGKISQGQEQAGEKR